MQKSTFRSIRRKKRKFHGNQYMSNEQQSGSNLSHNESSSITPTSSANISISSSKLTSNSILDSTITSKKE